MKYQQKLKLQNLFIKMMITLITVFIHNINVMIIDIIHLEYNLSQTPFRI